MAGWGASPSGLEPEGVARLKSLRPDVEEPLEGGGAFHLWLEPCSGKAEVSKRMVAGQPAVLRNGSMRYFAGWPEHGALQRIVRDAAAEAGLPAFDLPEGLRTRLTDNGRFWAYYGPDTIAEDTCPGSGRDLPPPALPGLPPEGGKPATATPAASREAASSRDAESPPYPGGIAIIRARAGVAAWRSTCVQAGPAVPP